ncbi:hypothetical protein AAMO2058_000872200 [Amorphochlora amoebiformis]
MAGLNHKPAGHASSLPPAAPRLNRLFSSGLEGLRAVAVGFDVSDSTIERLIGEEITLGDLESAKPEDLKLIKISEEQAEKVFQALRNAPKSASREPSLAPLGRLAARAREFGIPERTIKRLEERGVDDVEVFDLKTRDLVKIGVKLGPAIRVAKAIEAMKSEDRSAAPGLIKILETARLEVKRYFDTLSRLGCSLESLIRLPSHDLQTLFKTRAEIPRGHVIRLIRAVEDLQKEIAEEYFREGDAYFFGVNHRTRDVSRGSTLLKFAAELGHACAQGTCREFGLWDRKKDSKRAAECYLRGAEQGHTAAMNNIGCAYFGGYEGLEEDKDEAFYWISKAVKQSNERDGLAGMAACYHYAVGVKEVSNLNHAIHDHTLPLITLSIIRLYISTLPKTHSNTPCPSPESMSCLRTIRPRSHTTRKPQRLATQLPWPNLGGATREAWAFGESFSLMLLSGTKPRPTSVARKVCFTSRNGT